jgi:hypothetical protein
MKDQGFRPGAPDVMIYERWHDPKCTCGGLSACIHQGFGVAIELKAGRNTASDAQDVWLDALRARGWRVAVCRDMGSVMEVVSWVRRGCLGEIQTVEAIPCDKCGESILRRRGEVSLCVSCVYDDGVAAGVAQECVGGCDVACRDMDSVMEVCQWLR